MAAAAGELVEELRPARWLTPLLEWVWDRLVALGYPGGKVWWEWWLFSAVAAAHLTGVDDLFDYVLEAYNVLSEAVGDGVLAVPRWAPVYWSLEEEVDGLYGFEEALTDSGTVFFAEPLLALAVAGAGGAAMAPAGLRRRGFVAKRGHHTLLVSSPDGRRKIGVASSLYALIIGGLAALGLDTVPGQLCAVVPDPAWVRKTIFEERPLPEELADTAISLLREAGRLTGKARGPEEARRVSEELRGRALAICYRVLGPAQFGVEYA